MQRRDRTASPIPIPIPKNKSYLACHKKNVVCTQEMIYKVRCLGFLISFMFVYSYDAES